MPFDPASYLTVSEANDMAAALPDLAAWAGATAAQRAAALNQASADVDAAMPYQGRVFDPGQVRQFPRAVPDEPAPGGAWDWAAAANAAVVPRDVKLAVLFQADAVLAGTREPRLAAQHDGVVYELTGTLAESYKRTTGPGATTGLGRRAWLLMRPYRLRDGKLL